MNSIQQTILDSLSGKQKRTSNGWISFNAVRCHHNGERSKINVVEEELLQMVKQ